MQVDIINALFEFAGAAFISVSIARLNRDKAVAGVSWVSPAFFFVWGLWNLFYYPSLGQWWSFTAGLCLSTANAVWIGQLVYYTAQQRSSYDMTRTSVSFHKGT